MPKEDKWSGRFSFKRLKNIRKGNNKRDKGKNKKAKKTGSDDDDEYFDAVEELKDLQLAHGSQDNNASTTGDKGRTNGNQRSTTRNEAASATNSSQHAMERSKEDSVGPDVVSMLTRSSGANLVSEPNSITLPSSSEQFKPIAAPSTLQKDDCILRPSFFPLSLVQSSFRQPTPVRTTIMTSSYPESVHGLKNKLELLSTTVGLHLLIELEELPYSGLPDYRFSGDTPDVMILCHSIENRRFAVTDVQDALYDEFLQYCKATIGRERIVVIAHDFPPEDDEVRQIRMSSFRNYQPTTFQLAGLVIICGKLDRRVDMSDHDWGNLVQFLQAQR